LRGHGDANGWDTLDTGRKRHLPSEKKGKSGYWAGDVRNKFLHKGGENGSSFVKLRMRGVKGN